MCHATLPSAMSIGGCLLLLQSVGQLVDVGREYVIGSVRDDGNARNRPGVMSHWQAISAITRVEEYANLDEEVTLTATAYFEGMRSHNEYIFHSIDVPRILHLYANLNATPRAKIDTNISTATDTSVSVAVALKVEVDVEASIDDRYAVIDQAKKVAVVTDKATVILGPYSQVINANNLFFLSGVLGLLKIL
ncbi:hypothetical protein Goshw_014609 [Gossypium schwendimanii]|uniref:Uncharacterized protein n=1 Tax=Gossypium schwendimanii TaxID=34291 RepID=A0A7J9KSA5_GOSSC|nr:hypothetical protein [Gossypium schwendimanii]